METKKIRNESRYSRVKSIFELKSTLTYSTNTYNWKQLREKKISEYKIFYTLLSKVQIVQKKSTFETMHQQYNLCVKLKAHNKNCVQERTLSIGQ